MTRRSASSASLPNQLKPVLAMERPINNKERFRHRANQRLAFSSSMSPSSVKEAGGPNFVLSPESNVNISHGGNKSPMKMLNQIPSCSRPKMSKSKEKISSHANSALRLSGNETSILMVRLKFCRKDIAMLTVSKIPPAPPPDRSRVKASWLAVLALPHKPLAIALSCEGRPR